MTARHLQFKSSQEEIRLRGIKCDLPLKFKQSEVADIECELQRKARVLGYYDKRNGISTASLGDKPYKHASFAPEFYKVPGLIPGSTNKQYKRNAARKKQIDFTIDKNAKWPMRPQRVWSERVKEEAQQEDLQQVLAANKWEETVLQEHKNKNAPPEKPAPGSKPVAGAQGGKKK